MILTKRQKEALDFIKGFIESKGYAPSLKEIGRGLRLSSVATVHKHVSHLVKKGLVKRKWNQNRSIEILPEKVMRMSAEIPLLGMVAAGKPIEAVLQEEFIEIPPGMVKSGKSYVLRVKGNSMIDEQIRDGDYVIVEERSVAENGETVVALLENGEVTLKKFYKEKDQVRLQPANPEIAPIFVKKGDMRIQGVVIGILRKY
ncbi:MAG: transcriptional repressor LexA [Acidobacteriota bacterium]